MPTFNSKEFLLEHISSIMSFYHPRCIDKEVGGFFQNFRDDGSVYDSKTRHLVSSTRFIFNYAMAAKEFNNREYLDVAQHGIDYLRQYHLNSKTGGYAWVLNDKEIQDLSLIHI